MSDSRDQSGNGRWRRVIGIVGGLGPHAHIEFEKHLLLAAEPIESEQAYPPWILSSIPATANRTEALLHDGRSPVPAMVESLRRLQPTADFAVIACNTAHAFLEEIRRQVTIPILDWIGLTALELADRFGQGAKIGLLATTGTLQSAVYPSAARRARADLEWLSLLDLPDGQSLQEHLVMQTIYGTPGDQLCQAGLKGGLDQDPAAHLHYSKALQQAVEHLQAAGAQAVVLGCTELPLALDGKTKLLLEVVDPIKVAARAALAIASGRQPLPPRS